MSLPTGRNERANDHSSASSAKERDTSPAAAFSNARGRPFGAALGLDEPEDPRKRKVHDDIKEDEALFTVKVSEASAHHEVNVTDDENEAWWDSRIPCESVRNGFICEYHVGFELH